MLLIPVILQISKFFLLRLYASAATQSGGRILLDGQLVVPLDGVYKIDYYMNVHSLAARTVGVYLIAGFVSGNIILGSGIPVTPQGTYVSIGGELITSLTPGQTIGIFAVISGSTAAGAIVIPHSIFIGTGSSVVSITVLEIV